MIIILMESQLLNYKIVRDLSLPIMQAIIKLKTIYLNANFL